MKLPVMPPVSPMLAKSVASIPPGTSHEPKWDGFRSICFRDLDQVELGSRNERPMTRYFHEQVAAVRPQLPEHCVIDGEIIITTGRRRPLSSSTCSPSAMTTTPGDRSASAAPPSSTRWPARRCDGGIVGIYDPSTASRAAPSGSRTSSLTSSGGWTAGRSFGAGWCGCRWTSITRAGSRTSTSIWSPTSITCGCRSPPTGNSCATPSRVSESRPLDLNRPLWEMHAIDGVDNVPGVPSGSFAIFTKLHHAAVDGHSMRDIMSALHDPAPDVVPFAVADDWSPEPRPQAVGLLARAAVNNLVRSPLRLAQASARMVPAMGVFGRALVDRRRSRAALPGREGRDTDRAAGLWRARRPAQGRGVGGRQRLRLSRRHARRPHRPPGRAAAPCAREHVERQADAARHRRPRALRAECEVARRAQFHRFQNAGKRAVDLRQPPACVQRRRLERSGPQAPLYLNGARAERFFGVAPIFHGTAVVFGVFSYCRRIEVTFVSCRRLLLDPEFPTECLRASYEELGSSELMEAK
jgi:hypothetical protein